MDKKRSRKLGRISCGIVIGLAVLCLAGAGISALSNLSLPKGPEALDRLDPLDKIRLEETLRLKGALGEAVWPGLGETNIPISLHNQANSFLTGFEGEPPVDWEVVEGDEFQGKPYYRRAEKEAQNFAIPVGKAWVAGMATKSETDRFLVELYRGFLPPVIEQIFPYRLLLQPTETQIGGVLHESFHVFQALRVPERLDTAEKAHKLGERYWNADAERLDLWKDEINLLAKALEAKTDEEAAELARQLLAHRQWRRQQAGLTPELIDYERQLEWEEGLAKYVELEFLRQAYETKDYQPVTAMSGDASFKAYRGFKQRWSQEIIQMKLEVNQEGEISFYQTGMTQAFLLDRLSPGWKANALKNGIFLEDLLKEAAAKEQP
jgi:hypothetical protein